MNINDVINTRITILKKSESGRLLQKIVTHNQLTYVGATLVAESFVRGGLDKINNLHLRYAQSEVDAKQQGTNFEDAGDIKNVTKENFEDNTGTANGDVVAYAQKSIISSCPDSEEICWLDTVSFNFSFVASDLSGFKKGKSEIYFMGLGAEDSRIFSVLVLGEDQRFTLVGAQQIDLIYDLNIVA